MCLFIDKSIVPQVSKNKITGWKILVVSGDNKELLAPFSNQFMYDYTYRFTYKWGVVYSGRQTVDVADIEKELSEINQGIHVFLDKQEALNYMNMSMKTSGSTLPLKNCVLVRVTGDVQDLVASGICHLYAQKSALKSAVFTKVHLSREEWRKARKG